VRHGVLDQPVVGASVFAVNARSGAVVSSAISGHTQCAFAPAVGSCTTFADPAFTVLDGAYTLPVPAGTYKIGVEASDGLPATQVSNRPSSGRSWASRTSRRSTTTARTRKCAGGEAAAGHAHPGEAGKKRRRHRFRHQPHDHHRKLRGRRPGDLYAGAKNGSDDAAG